MSGHDPLGPVVIGAREVYDAVMRLTATVERLVDGHADAERKLQDHEARSDRRHDDHEVRLRALERARWPLPALAVLVSVAALVLPLVVR